MNTDGDFNDIAVNFGKIVHDYFMNMELYVKTKTKTKTK